MAEFFINDQDLVSVKGKVVIVTGGSSGIGLATVNLLVSLGARVVSGDTTVPASTDGFLFVKTDVSIWSDLTNLFKKTKEAHGRIDCVFANAGVGPRANYLEIETDEKGELKEPTHELLGVSLIGVINTGCLAVHYFKQQPEGGSLVLMGSSTAIQPLRAVDYSTAKHGVLGFGRGMGRLVEAAGLPIRINTLAPCWTSTQILPDLEGIMKAISHESQSPLVVARAVVLLMVDASKRGDVVYIADGKYTEIEKAVLAPAFDSIKGDSPSDDEILARILALAGP